MAYPRRCPLCRATYSTRNGPQIGHVSLGSEEGGTPSPWRPGSPGRLILLGCQFCGSAYWWDYFAGIVPTDRPIGQRWRGGQTAVAGRAPATAGA